MRHVFLAAAAVATLAASAAFASPLGDAKAGLAAFDKGDNLTAIRLFTAAINSRQLSRSDQELAYLKRAEAYLAAHQQTSALADANHALDLDPRDSEAVATRDRARALMTSTPAPPVVQRSMTDYTPPKSDDPPKADYDAAQASYEAQKKAAADAYARQMADYDAQVKAESDRHAADLAAWRRDVEDCKAGMLSKCGAPAKGQPAAPAETAAPPDPPPAKPAAKSAALPAAKPNPAPAKIVKKPSPPPAQPDRPAIY